MPKITAKQSTYIKWQAPEYEHREKSSDWFWMVGIITIALVFAAILLKNLLFGILAGLAGFSIALYGARKPSVVNFRIGPKGIEIGNKIYDYENLNSFWVNYDPPRRKDLILESKKAIMPHIVIFLGDADPEEIRQYLLQFLKEVKIEESLTNTIAKLLGF